MNVCMRNAMVALGSNIVERSLSVENLDAHLEYHETLYMGAGKKFKPQGKQKRVQPLTGDGKHIWKVRAQANYDLYFLQYFMWSKKSFGHPVQQCVLGRQEVIPAIAVLNNILEISHEHLHMLLVGCIQLTPGTEKGFTFRLLC